MGLTDFLFYGIRKGPGVSAPIQLMDQSKAQSNDSNGHAKLKQPQKSMEFDLADAECLQRFLKIKVKQVTESDGTVTGTLLVTPNCLMFDPDLSHPLVKENGTDLYGMVANLEDVVSVSVYKHIADLTGEEKRSEGIYDPSHVSKCISPREKREAARSALNSVASDPASTPKTPPVFGLELPNTPNGISMSPQDSIPPDPTPVIPPRTGTTPPLHTAASLSSNASDSQLPSIKEEDKGTPTTPGGNIDAHGQLQVASAKRRTVSDLTPDQKTPIEEVIGPTSANKTDRQRCHSDLEPSTSIGSSGPSTPRNSRFHAPFSRYSPDVARRSFGRLGRTLSARANSIKGTVQSGAQTVASGTQKVAHGVVTHTKSAADQIQTGIQTGAKMVASVPGSIVNVGTGLLQEGQSSMSELFSLSTEEPVSPKSMKREKSLAKLESLREKTKQAREQQANVSLKDDLMKHSDSMEDNIAKDVNSAANLNGPIGTPPSPPYYLTVRLDRKRRKKHRIQGEEDARELCATLSSDYGSKGVAGFGNTRKREFWFAVPRARVDAIYHFLLQWSPDKYGQDIKEAVAAATNNSYNENGAPTDPAEDFKTQKTYINERGFIVLDSEVEDYLASEKPKGMPFALPHSSINREWEIVTMKELCRRLSLDDSLEAGEMPLPQGSTDSQILDEFMINQIVDILPPRAEGYPWIQIYNSEKHGFSLTTMYRKMAEWKDEMSPMLLLIRDVEGHVFGAISSSALLPKESYYGTGDSSLLFRFTGEYPHTRELRSYTWTGENQFFINAAKEFLSMGAGGGHYGLYLDADLNVGRSQRCATFNNEPLAGGIKEDFQIQFVEAFGFHLQ
ncbi:hypothetical protein M3Y97_01121600 [Aphelenchoides bicaudatus]|nr:hypothetical protein M3Y97_01121600 [Aphelenchoides bicaudatus]